jgi:hypothetical protein
MLDRLYKFFTSLKLTVVLLGLGLVLVFWGTLAQVHLGLYKAQNDFFRSFFVYWQPEGSGARIPVFPGGYLVGAVLLVNLFAAHLRYYKPGLKKLGIAMIHIGVVLLLVGQLLTDLLSTECSMFIRNGERKNFAESNSRVELAIVDVSGTDADKVVAVSDSRLRMAGDITHPELPFTVKVLKYMGNSAISETQTNGYTPIPATVGIGANAFWQEFAHVTAMDERDMPSALVELSAGTASLGKYLVSLYLLRPQTFEHAGRSYTMALRPERFYKPFSLHLLEFRHDKYAGTDIPKNFSSRVRILRPETGEDREVVIYMNNPLRYEGETYYQAGFDRDDQGTRLQVVRNPGWLTPYFACVMVALGMMWQFCFHLFGFGRNGKSA